MVKSRKCGNCGANVTVRGNNYYCEYCGSSFVASAEDGESPKANAPMERPKMTDQVLKTYAFNTGSKVAIIPIVAFAILWCSVTFGMAIATFVASHGAEFMGIVPLFMGIFGLVMFILSIKSSLGPKEIRQAGKLAANGNWEAAYQTLKESYTKRITAQVGTSLIFVTFFKFNKDEEARQYIRDLNQLSYTGNNKVKEIADYLGESYGKVNYAFHSEAAQITSDTLKMMNTLSSIASINHNINVRVNRSHDIHSGFYGPHGPRPPRN